MILLTLCLLVEKRVDLTIMKRVFDGVNKYSIVENLQIIIAEERLNVSV